MKFRSLFCFVFWILLNSQCFAHGWKEHSQDMLFVTGLYTSKKNSYKGKNLQMMYPFVRLINLMIDEENTASNTDWYSEEYGNFKPSDYYQLGENKKFYQELQYEYRPFDKGSATHRIMFHWGMHTNPNQVIELHNAFTKSFNARYPKAEYSDSEVLYQIEKEDRERFFRKIEFKQLERRLNIIEAAKKFFDTNDQNFSESLAGIYYNVHLLGDHVEHSNEYTKNAVLTLYDIRKEIDEYVDNLSDNDMKGIYTDFRQDLYNIDIANMESEKAANEFLHTLSRHLPKMLRMNYPEIFIYKKYYNSTSGKNEELRFLDYDSTYGCESLDEENEEC